MKVNGRREAIADPDLDEVIDAGIGQILRRWLHLLGQQLGHYDRAGA